MVSWFEIQVSAEEGRNLPQNGEYDPLLPNYCNFGIKGLSGKDMAKGIAVLYQYVCVKQTNKTNGSKTKPKADQAQTPRSALCSLLGRFPLAAVLVAAGRGAAGSWPGALWRELGQRVVMAARPRQEGWKRGFALQTPGGNRSWCPAGPREQQAGTAGTSTTPEWQMRCIRSSAVGTAGMSGQAGAVGLQCTKKRGIMAEKMAGQWQPASRTGQRATALGVRLESAGVSPEAPEQL